MKLQYQTSRYLSDFEPESELEFEFEELELAMLLVLSVVVSLVVETDSILSDSG